MIDKLKAWLPSVDLSRAKLFLVWVWEWVSSAAVALWRSCVAVGLNPMTYPAMALVGVLGWYGGHTFGARHQNALKADLITAMANLDASRKELARARTRVGALEESITHLQSASAAPVATPAARPKARPVAKVEAPAPPPAPKPFTWPN